MNDIDWPKGYKPVRCRDCDRTLAWVKQHVKPHERIHAADGLTLEGESVLPGAKLPACPDCPPTFSGPRI